MSGDFILETENLSKEFAGFIAVNDVSLRVARGTIHALIGPNGAGKTTFIDTVSGLCRAKSGFCTGGIGNDGASDAMSSRPSGDRSTVMWK